MFVLVMVLVLVLVKYILVYVSVCLRRLSFRYMNRSLYPKFCIYVNTF